MSSIIRDMPKEDVKNTIFIGGKLKVQAAFHQKHVRLFKLFRALTPLLALVPVYPSESKKLL